MRPLRLILGLLVIGSALQTGCNTTESYGYYAEALNPESIATLLGELDRSINDRDYETVRGLFSPHFVYIDEAKQRGGGKDWGGETMLSRASYLTSVEKLLDDARTVELYTRIKEIEFLVPGQLAKVDVEEEEFVDSDGVKLRTISLAHYEVGIEDNWIFFKRYTRFATQEIKD